LGDLLHAVPYRSDFASRAQAWGINIWRLAQIILWFAQSLTIEKVHPLQGGFVRLKNRRERRPELPVEPLWKLADLGDHRQTLARCRGLADMPHLPSLGCDQWIAYRAVTTISTLLAGRSGIVPIGNLGHQRIMAQMASARRELWRRSCQRRIPKRRKRFPDEALPRP
jgi:hypothetical protein